MDESSHSLAGTASKELVASTIKAIQTWRDEKPSILAIVAGKALTPVTWIAEFLIPTAAIAGLLNGADWLAKQSTVERDEKCNFDLEACDSRANAVINIHIAAGIAEGAAVGVVGIAALPVDIPAMVLLSLRLVRQIGLEYGFDQDNEDERAFVRSILAAVGANSQEQKAQALGVGAFLAKKIARETFKKMTEVAAVEKLGVDAAIIGIRNLAKSLGINLTKRKMLAAIPIAGAVVGASVNGWYLHEVGIAAQRSFQSRWLQDRALPAPEPASTDPLLSSKVDLSSKSA